MIYISILAKTGELKDLKIQIKKIVLIFINNIIVLQMLLQISNQIKVFMNGHYLKTHFYMLASFL